MYAQDIRPQDQKNIAIVNGKMILSDRIHIQDYYNLKRKIVVGNTEFSVYALSSIKIAVIDDLLDLNYHSLVEWSRSPLQ